MRLDMSVCLLGLLPIVTSCAGYHWVEFKSSSLDFNDNKVHRITLKNADPPSVVERITALAEKRDVVLVFSSCKGNTCECSFKRKPQTVAVGSSGTIQAAGFGSGLRTRAIVTTDQKSVSISSLMFSRITKQGDDAVVEMLGVPVLYENVVSCPMSLEVERRCRRTSLRVPDGKTPEQVFRSQMGVDISGQREAQIITGILAELRRAPKSIKVSGDQ
jgi:hypothetical protein